MPKREKKNCWQCDSVLKQCSSSSSSTGMPGDDVLRCPECKTKSRHALELSNQSLAHAPFWKSSTRGFEARYDAFVKVAFCVGVRMNVDTMMHVIPSKDSPVSERMIDRFSQQCRMELHQGSMLVLKCGRASVWQPQRSKSAQAGGPPAPESKKETVRALKARVNTKTCLGASDAGKGIAPGPHVVSMFVAMTVCLKSTANGGKARPQFSRKGTHVGGLFFPTENANQTYDPFLRSVVIQVAAFQSLNMQTAVARHQLDELTPVKTYKDASRNAEQRKTVRRLAVLKRPAARMQAHNQTQENAWLVIGGDNSAESEFSRAKGMIRRQSLHGRVGPAVLHMSVLAGKRQLEKPGVAQYRSKRVSCLGHRLHDILDPAKDREWLFQRRQVCACNCAR